MVLATISIALLLVSFAAVGRCDLPHYTTYKSFFMALYECGEYFQVDNATMNQYICAGYPSVPEMKRLIHCALVNIGAWNDETGVRKNVISYYFLPNSLDTEYEQRTQLCLDKICPEDNDQNNRAYETFSCYFSQYGRLNKNEVYVPLESFEYFQVLRFVKILLNVSRERVVQLVQGDFLNDPLFKPMLYIEAVRIGVFTWDKGFLMDVAYQLYDIPELISPCTLKCVDDVSAQYCTADKQELVYQVYKQCLNPFLESRFRAKLQGSLNNGPCEEVGF